MSVSRFPFRTKFPFLAALALLLPIGGLHAQGSGDAFARRVLAEVNLARTQPDRYADFLAGCRSHYRDHFLALPGEPLTRTREGISALDEAVRALRHTRPLSPLALSGGLGKAAAELAREQARTGALGHRSADGSSPFARMSRHGRWHSHAGEAIDYGGATAQRIVYNLIVDDGVRDRGHRLNLLAPDFRVAGVARASHPQFHQVCVIDLAAAYTEAGVLAAAASKTNEVAATTAASPRMAQRPTAGLVPPAPGGWRH